MRRLLCAGSAGVAGVLATLLHLACAPVSQPFQPPELSPEAAETAENLAGFDLSCEPEELSVQAFHERWQFDTQVVLVGAAGCGRRSYYEVRCGRRSCWAKPLTSIRALEPGR